MNTPLDQGLATYNGRMADAGGRVLRASDRPGETLAAAMYAAPPYRLTVPPMGVARLSINLTPGRVEGGLDGDRAQVFRTRRHSVFLTPAGAGAAWCKEASSRHINIYFQARTFGDGDDDEWSNALGKAVHLRNAGVPGVAPLFDMLAAELAEGSAFGAEAVDSLARLILMRLARHEVQGTVRSSSLTPAVRARVTEFIRSRLDRRLMVSELAAVAGLSPNRFAQAFTRSVGKAPHQYVLQLRIEQAVQLLQHSNHRLADIAAACGFASQQHMTNVMRRHLGITPARQRTHGLLIPWAS